MMSKVGAALSTVAPPDPALSGGVAPSEAALLSAVSPPDRPVRTAASAEAAPIAVAAAAREEVPVASVHEPSTPSGPVGRLRVGIDAPNGLPADVKIAKKEFPLLRTVTLTNGDTGALL